MVVEVGRTNHQLRHEAADTWLDQMDCLFAHDPPPLHVTTERGPLVYFVQEGIGDYYKIGYTSKDVSRRVSSFRTGNFRDMTVVCTLPCSCNGALERVAHLAAPHFSLRNIAREWFFGERAKIEMLFHFLIWYGMGTGALDVHDDSRYNLIRITKGKTDVDLDPIYDDRLLFEYADIVEDVYDDYRKNYFLPRL